MKITLEISIGSKSTTVEINGYAPLVEVIKEAVRVAAKDYDRFCDIK